MKKEENNQGSEKKKKKQCTEVKCRNTLVHTRDTRGNGRTVPNRRVHDFLQKVATIHLYPTAVMGNADLVLPGFGVFQEKSEICILT